MLTEINETELDYTSLTQYAFLWMRTRFQGLIECKTNKISSAHLVTASHSFLITSNVFKMAAVKWFSSSAIQRVEVEDDKWLCESCFFFYYYSLPLVFFTALPISVIFIIHICGENRFTLQCQSVFSISTNFNLKITGSRMWSLENFFLELSLKHYYLCLASYRTSLLRIFWNTNV